MRPFLAIAAIVGLCANPLSAGAAGQSAEPQIQRDQNGQEATDVASGVICNTREQAQRLVSLQKQGNELDEAVGRVNTEAHNPKACGSAFVAFRVAERLDGDQIDDEAIQLVKIIVTAISDDGERWSSVPSIVKYALMPPAGIDI